ncbi:MAG: glycoside hydrolase family 3 protein [Leptospirales bacterium]|nr:glycoside hydrolase family 3 protein [Leptospirales bacterium]
MKRLSFWLAAGAALLLVMSAGAYVCAQNLQQARLQEMLEQAPQQILARMSLEDKVGQLIHIGMRGKDASGAVLNDIRRYRPGGVILFAVNLGDAGRIRALNEGLQRASVAASGIPLLISIDQEGGRVVRVGPDGVDQFPAAMALGQSNDPTLVEEVGFMTGYQLRKLGLNLALAPVLDVNSNPANPVINTRSFGSDPERVANIGLALARGLRASGNIPTVKHFPGHGDTNVDSHLDLPVVHKSLESMRAMELAPFRAAIGEGAEIIMSAHIVFENYDSQNPATLSPRILKDLLRGELGFRGLVMTDAMEMNAISRRYARGMAARKAFQAGADIVLLTSDGTIIREMYDSLLRGFQSGELSVDDLNQAVLRQVRLKFLRGAFYSNASPLSPTDAALTAHFQSLQQAADERAAAIEAKYRRQNLNLNRVASRAAIAALRRPYAGLPLERRKQVRLLYSSEEVRQEALLDGLSAEQLIFAPRSVDLYQIFRRRKAGEVWMLELDERSVSAWNRIVQVLNASSEARLKGGVIGLLAASPYLRALSPNDGALLCSFASTPESRRGLVYRALAAGSVPQADLILPAL